MAVLEANRVADSGGATLTVPPGTLIFHCANSAPSGFLKANGASLNTTTYAALFAAIGYTFGGSGSSFTLPDMRGEFPRGWDDGRAVDSGRVFGTAQSATRIGHMATFGGDIDISNADSLISISRSKVTINNNFTATRNDSTVRPRNIALLACIKF